MQKKQLLMILAIVTICIATCSGVSFQYKDRTCDYWEFRRSGPGPRKLQISCSGTHDPAQAEYSCTYKGNPHGCPQYNNGRQAQYYAGLVDAMVRASTLCSVDAPNVTNRQLCPRVVFTLVRDLRETWKLPGSSEETTGDVKLDEDFLVNPDEMRDEEEDDDLIFRPDV